MPMVALSLLAFLAGCNAPEPRADSGSPEPSPTQQSSAGSGQCTGPVLETTDAGGYTYVRLECGDKEVWAAGPQTALEVGDEVSLDQSMVMESFFSKSLNRTFDSILFVTSFEVAGERGESGVGGSSANPAIGDAHKSPIAPPVESAFDFLGIQKVEGGKTVEEIYAGMNDLSGKNVLVRGKVVKFTPGVMGKNWIHLQDGTGAPDANDLTVTTSATVKIGDIILVKGQVELDKDFGFGYQYDVLIVDAGITVE